MPVPTDQLSEEMGEVKAELRDLSRNVADLRTEFREFRVEARTQLSIIKWIGVFFAGTLVALFSGSIYVAWNASALNSDVKLQGRQLNDLTSEVKQHGTRLEKVEKRLEGVESRLDGMGKRLDGLDGRLDGMAKQLDVLIRRSESKSGT
jgi:predicted  nucleic acid-binding Zn-ribbon protein